MSRIVIVILIYHRHKRIALTRLEAGKKMEGNRGNQSYERSGEGREN
jgi:hypothetical protein